MSVEAVTRTLADAGVRYAAIGAAALAARGGFRWSSALGNGDVSQEQNGAASGAVWTGQFIELVELIGIEPTTS